MKNVAIHLLALAGTGKLTIAQELCEMTDATLVDNHLINNPVFRVAMAGGNRELPDKIWALTHKIREAVMEAVETCAPAGASFIFTNAPVPGDEPELKLVQQTCEHAGKTYIPIRLVISEEELVRRATAPGRADNHKDTSEHHARQAARRDALLATSHANETTIDVSALEPREAAELIRKHVETILKPSA